MNKSEQPDDYSEWVETWVLPYIDDWSLWPVLVALLGHVAVMISPLVLMAWRTMHPAVFMVVFVLLSISGHIIITERRIRGHLGGITAAVVLLWTMACTLAGVAEWTGVF